MIHTNEAKMYFNQLVLNCFCIFEQLNMCDFIRIYYCHSTSPQSCDSGFRE